MACIATYCVADDNVVLRDAPPCGQPIQVSPARICKDKVSDAEARAVLGDATKNAGVLVSADSVLVAMRASSDEFEYLDRPYLCCDIQAYLDLVGENLFAARFMVKDARTLNIGLFPVNMRNGESRKLSYAGSEKFIIAEQLVSEQSLRQRGLDVQVHTLDGSSLMGERKIALFRGRNCVISISDCTIVYMADGESLRTFVFNAHQAGVALDSFVLAGIYGPGGRGNDLSNARIDELLFGYSPPRFDAYMAFLKGPVISFVEGDASPKARFVAGSSNGGAWALDALQRFPKTFTGAIAMSTAIWKDKFADDLAGKKIYLGSGTLEGLTTEQTRRIANVLRNHGASVRETYPASGHSTNAWVNIFNDALCDIQGCRRN